MIDIRHGDCAAVLRGMEDACVDLTVTSPPYDSLRTYKGYSFDFEAIARELFRVTKPGGVVVWVVADATVKGSETGTSFRQALHFKDIGFNLHDTMIWHKEFASVPTQDRYYNVFEYMFVFSKGAPKTLNLIADRKNKQAGRLNKIETCIGKERKPKTDRWRVTADYSRRYNVWEQNTAMLAAFGRKHPAAFPEQLACDHIASWSNPGDTVLDPFLGSGTTGKMALQAGRRFVGIEISEEYVRLATDRIATARGDMGLFAIAAE
jgi:DNA modification methylase